MGSKVSGLAGAMVPGSGYFQYEGDEDLAKTETNLYGKELDEQKKVVAQRQRNFQTELVEQKKVANQQEHLQKTSQIANTVEQLRKQDIKQAVINSAINDTGYRAASNTVTENLANKLRQQQHLTPGTYKAGKFDDEANKMLNRQQAISVASSM